MENRKYPVSWPGWEVIQQIGQGSYGTVYELRRNILGDVERAALKIITIPHSPEDIQELRAEGYDDASITARFHAHLQSIVGEYKVMAKMKGHRNIVLCDDVRFLQHPDGLGWDISIKMELLNPLMKLPVERFQEEEILRLGIDLCRALEQCQKMGIIHRDIKPQNIFISEDGHYKLGDFGIAKAIEGTSSGTKAGTYRFMAPEVYNHQPYGAGADQYSLGMVLYWLLNNRRVPFVSNQMPVSFAQEEEVRERRFRGEPLPPPANGSPGLQNCVLKACSFDPTRRFSGPEELRRCLEKLQNKTQYADPQQPACTVVFHDGQGNVVSRNRYPLGAAVTIPQIAQSFTDDQYLYTFEGWNPAVQPVALGDTYYFPRYSRKRRKKWGPVLALALWGVLAVGALGRLGTPEKPEPRIETAPPSTLAETKPEPTRSAAEPETVWTPVTVIVSEARASSVYDGDTVSHSPYNLLDGSGQTNWTEGAEGYGIGEYVEFVFLKPYVLESVTIHSGIGYNQVLFAKNTRPMGILLSFSDGSSVFYTLQDTSEPQVISFGGRILTSSMRITIQSVYPGTTWEETVLSEVSFQAVEESVQEESRQAEMPREEPAVYPMGFRGVIGGGFKHSVVLKQDGTVFTAGSNELGQCNVAHWQDIVSVSAGEYYTLGLRRDGTVLAAGDNSFGQCAVTGWTDMVAVSAGTRHSVGLRADGTVVAVGENKNGQCNVSGWRDIIAVEAGYKHTVGLKADGTVVAVGLNADGQCEVSGWRDIVAISSEGWHTVGLKADGTVVAVGLNTNGQCEISAWRDIIAIVAEGWHTVGLKADGTVVAVGLSDGGECDVSHWTDVVAIAAGNDHTLGVKSDGTIFAAGESHFGQCNFSGWRG